MNGMSTTASHSQFFPSMSTWNLSGYAEAMADSVIRRANWGGRRLAEARGSTARSCWKGWKGVPDSIEMRSKVSRARVRSAASGA
jgi:hypothetical protein